MIAPGSTARAGQFVGKFNGAGGRRFGIRYFEDRGDSAQHSAGSAASEVFFMFEARFSEVALRIDDAWQDM